jgi:hypothetical protein
VEIAMRIKSPDLHISKIEVVMAAIPLSKWHFRLILKKRKKAFFSAVTKLGD